MGRWFRSFKQTRTKSVALIGPGEGAQAPTESSRTKQHFVPFGEPYVIHPGRFALGATLEWLKLPGDLSGYVTGKSSLGRHGLVIETAAGLSDLEQRWKAKEGSSEMSRFLITFDDFNDPRPEVVKLIRRRLEPTPVELVTPGVLAVESDESTVRSAIRDLPEWRVAREGLLSDTPPSRGRLSTRG